MCNSLSSRLEKLNRRLVTITKLRAMEAIIVDYFKPFTQGSCATRKPSKPCTCPHHKETLNPQTVKCCCGKGYSSCNSEKSVYCCPKNCKPQQKSCICNEPELKKLGREKQSGQNKSGGSKGRHDQDQVGTRIKSDANRGDVRNAEDDTREISSKISQAKKQSEREDSTSGSNTQSKGIDVKLNTGRDNANESMIPDTESYENEGAETWDKKNIERMHKDLLNEKKRTLELELKLKELTCSVKCLKDDGEQRAACLREALEKAEEQAKLAGRSRNIAMDLAKQSRDQTDVIKANRDELLDRVANLKNKVREVVCEKTKLACECRDLRCKLKAMAESEAKKCAEITDEVGRIKCAMKEKENALGTEKRELEETVAELTNAMKIQKKRICDLTGICGKQQNALHQNTKCISEKEEKLCELQCKLDAMALEYREAKEEIENLKCCCSNFKRELEDFKENHCCDLKIKDKVIEDQDETIKRLKKLLQDSEMMAQQVAREFEQLTDQLYSEQETSKLLRATLEEAEARLAEKRTSGCRNCELSENELECLEKQKNKALLAAKFATQKLCESTKEYQKQLNCEKRQLRFMMILLRKKEEEIGCLKMELSHSRDLATRRSSCTD